MNETALELQMPLARGNGIRITCGWDNQDMDTIKVFVGEAPTKIIRFSCKSIDWQRMECRMDIKPNAVYITRQASFAYDGKQVRNNTYSTISNR